MAADRSSGFETPEELPAEMTAVRVHRFGAAPQLDRLPLPHVAEGEVLVKMAASVVSHHDLTVAGGRFAVRPVLPYIPGLEGAGTVVRVGAGVDPKVAPGSLVRLYGGGLGASRPGTWAEYVAAPGRVVVEVPPSLDVQVAAACGSVALTAWIALFEVGDMQRGERVGVAGASGAVGSLVVQLALAHGAGAVVALVRDRERGGALPPGVEVVVGDGGIETPVDLLVDTVGGPRLSSRVGMVEPGGRIAYLGYTAGQEACFTLPNLLARDVRLLPVNMMRRRSPRDLEGRLVAQFATGDLQVATVGVEARRLSTAVEQLRAGRARGRVVVRW
ncbi:MAG: quinone oxidoreductase family protein [Acidimicrobiales bacterium]